MSDTELKPCPCCGSKAEYQWQESGTVSPAQLDNVDIWCTNESCGLLLRIDGKEPDDAFNVWNTRTEQGDKPDHSELIAEIDAWINAPLDKTASLEEYDLQVTILLTDALKALKGD